MEPQSVDTPETNMISRRRMITSILAGGAMAAAPVLVGRASADSGSTATTVAQPERSDADNSVLNALLSQESRMVATYNAALGASLSKDDIAALELIRDNHLAYVHAIKGYLGTSFTAPSNAPLASPAGNLAAVANALAALEDQTLNLHLGAMASLAAKDSSTLIASIITMEARHSTALAIVAGNAPTAAASR